MTERFPLSVREAFRSLPDEAAHIATKQPNSAQIFTPADHQGALDPHRSVVVGDRGTGKSFWSSVLTHDVTRGLVASSYPRLGLDRVEGQLGFSGGEMAADHPSRSVIDTVMKAGYGAEDLWRAVMLKLAPFRPQNAPQSDDWTEWTRWVAGDGARRNAEFRAFDEALVKENKIYVLVVDALDLIANDWAGIRRQMEGLIRLALAVRALRAVRIKMFIRPDMADDGRLWTVGDASKLRHSEVLLTWKRRDLYGLLWTLLANATDETGAGLFREFCVRTFGLRFSHSGNVWRPDPTLVDDEDLQQRVFRALAGDYMGAGPTKGDTYKWVPNHLSDAGGFAAPRSFLLAMRAAAVETKSQETVLDKAGIEAGTRSASKVRVGELSEDYRWMETVLKDMERLVVPLTENELAVRWRERRTLETLKTQAQEAGNDGRYIPPGQVLQTPEDDAYPLLINHLVSLKIFIQLSDGRINMPDLFRLHANVKRKGGMRPRL